MLWWSVLMLSRILITIGTMFFYGSSYTLAVILLLKEIPSRLFLCHLIFEL
jgi:hypothetical protein